LTGDRGRGNSDSGPRGLQSIAFGGETASGKGGGFWRGLCEKKKNKQPPPFGEEKKKGPGGGPLPAEKMLRSRSPTEHEGAVETQKRSWGFEWDPERGSRHLKPTVVTTAPGGASFDVKLSKPMDRRLDK